MLGFLCYTLDPGRRGTAVMTGTMPRFVALDGLRAWMAWLVVLSHVAQQAGLRESRFWSHLFQAGNWGVQTFIIISGFVISHLLIERPQPYAAYIVPRFMRLFPAFAIATVIGALTYLLAGRVADPAWFSTIHGELYASELHYLSWHVLAHLTMLHGALPNTLLPLSEYAFLPPAWSVSLEWQFYLVAPAIIWCTRSGPRLLALVAATILSAMIYHHWFAGAWRQPSILAGASPFFLIGIGTRLALPALAGTVRYPAATALAVLAAAFAINVPAVGFWGVVIAFILAAPERSSVDRAFVSLGRMLLESEPAQIAADQSYSTYLLHWPVMMMVGAFLTGLLHMQIGAGLALSLLPATAAITATGQYFLHRFVEQPGRDLGRRWARRTEARPMTEFSAERA